MNLSKRTSLLLKVWMGAMSIPFFANGDYPARKDLFLEVNPETSAEVSLARFIEKGGTFHLLPLKESRFKILPGDAVYPICSAGWCRSQTVHAFLRPYREKILLFAPHGARMGWDPYNGEINRHLNREGETVPDEYPMFFGEEKTLRIGFENDALWKDVEKNITKEGLDSITSYYNDHLYGPSSLQNEDQHRRRVYIVFTVNAHIVLHRLVQTNESLENVHIVACNLDDIMTTPPEELNTYPRSTVTYETFLGTIRSLFDVEDLH